MKVCTCIYVAATGYLVESGLQQSMLLVHANSDEYNLKTTNLFNAQSYPHSLLHSVHTCVYHSDPSVEGS